MDRISYRRSPPARVVWIEMHQYISKILAAPSPPARVVWIEICGQVPGVPPPIQSPPARVVWIEIQLMPYIEEYMAVATREGGVD